MIISQRLLLFLLPTLTAALLLPKQPSFKTCSALLGVRYKLGADDDGDDNDAAQYWIAPLPVNNILPESIVEEAVNLTDTTESHAVARDETSRHLRSALWDEQHFVATNPDTLSPTVDEKESSWDALNVSISLYPDIDLSIPETVYSQDGKVDLVWDLLRYEAYEQAKREPLLVSFLHSNILNHPSLESSLAFLLANRLQSPAMMISTQLQSLVLDALQHSPVFRRSLRADIMAVRDRDPACSYLPDAFLYFKGFHALQTHRVAHYLWNQGKQTQALFLQSQSSQTFQIDIHPAATLGSGILIDHGTGVVVGSTVRSRQESRTTVINTYMGLTHTWVSFVAGLGFDWSQLQHFTSCHIGWIREERCRSSSKSRKWSLAWSGCHPSRSNSHW